MTLHSQKPLVFLEDDPLWYKDAIIYELHVKSFFDSTNDGIGDFRGLSQKLDYLTDLGVTALWILPFYPSPLRDDGYDISDYRGVHSQYGTLRDFKVFVREAHRRGLRVITELVVNHTSDQHPWFQAARRAKPGSARRNFYVWSDTDQRFPETRIIFCDTESSNWTWDPVAGAYYWHRFYSHQPDLNLNNPRVVKEVVKVMRFWLDLGVDGLRLDAIPYLCVREGTNNENLPETHGVIKQVRREIDSSYRNVMLLAEANQWPEDVRPYFGDGDECHMAFHFPLMPRIFIALRREDRAPITDIMNRTPDIPETCQWALFLRNHDELTLEMVSSEERDFMWREYAEDPRMKLNLGIRRRLAPLVDNSFRRLELLHSLLFSFPGTPVIYSGDEIGMGDNIFLGDRDGVRTPMQWSADRNAGFSRADPARLYLPVIMDPVYGYEAVNVESQQRDRSSFLNFIKRMLVLRRQFKAFGRGSLEFVRPQNRKVLVYFRKYREEVILCVVNLSRYSQPAELDLSEYQGWHPIEIFGRTEFPRIGELPYFLTIGPHGFYWFKLEPEAQPIRNGLGGAAESNTTPTVMTESVDDDLFDQAQVRGNLEEAIKDYISTQPWYQGRDKTVRKCFVQETVKIGVRLYFVFIRVDYEDEMHEHYFLPLRVVLDEAAKALAEEVPESLVAYIKLARGGGVLADALYDRNACKVILQMIHNERAYPTSGMGEVRTFSTKALDGAIDSLDAYGEVVPLVENRQNAYVNFGSKAVLKLYRRVAEGPSHELELSHFLSWRRGFTHIPRLFGWLRWTLRDGQVVHLGVCRQYVERDGDLWADTVEALNDSLSPNIEERAEGQSLFSSEYGSLIELFGKSVSEFHLELSSDTQVKNFPLATFGEGDLENLSASVLSELSRCISALGPWLAEYRGSREFGERVIAMSDQVVNCVNALSAELLAALREKRLVKIRIHGNLHLGQALRSGGNLRFVGLEGDTSLPLRRRCAPVSPLSDIADIVKSFGEAACSAVFAVQDGVCVEAGSGIDAQAVRFVQEASRGFVESYLAGTSDTRLSMDSSCFDSLLRLCLLEKAIVGKDVVFRKSSGEAESLIWLLYYHVFPAIIN